MWQFYTSIGRSPSRLALILFPLVVAGSLLLWGAGAEAIAATYTTNFPLTENLISQGGHWINGLTTGIDWSDVATTPGKAFGTQTGTGLDYADSTALLTGTWGADQTAQATVYITSEDRTHDTEEVELRLRSSLSPHSCTGYEINFSVKPHRPYCQIVRWNGPLGNFNFLFTGNVGVVTGDVVKATAIGNTITMYINNFAIASVVDNTFPSGNPGMGFYLQGGLGPPLNYGFSNYAASDGFAAVILATEPANLKGYWKCHETSGTTLADSSGNSKDLTITGAINTNYWLGEAGEHGTCFRTDGVAGYASRNDAVIPSLDNTNFTLFALFKGSTDFGVAAALAITNSSTNNDRAQIGEFSTTSQALAQARGNSSVMASGFSGGTAFDGSWHSVAFRRKGTAFELFVDGTRVASTTATLATGSTCNRTTLMHKLTSGTTGYAKGSIQHAAIWDTALSDSEIVAIQTARTVNPTPTPTPTPGSFAAVILATEPANLKGYWKCHETSGTTLADSSGNSKDLTITGAINTNYWLGEAGEHGTCFRTDGVAGYASRNDAVIPSLDNTNFTLFALFKGGTDFGVAAALAITNSSTNNDRAQIGEFSTTSQALAQARGNSSVMASGFSGGTAFDGSWHSVAFRRKGTAFELFVDGTRVASTTATLATGSTCNRTTLMHKLTSGTTGYAKGSIQHAAIWDTALSDSEIVAIQTARTIPP